MPKNMAMTKEDKKWQAESDVRTLMQAREIQADAARMRAAKAAAERQAKEAAKVAKAMPARRKK